MALVRNSMALALLSDEYQLTPEYAAVPFPFDKLRVTGAFPAVGLPAE